MFVDDMPYSDTGKVVRRQLVALISPTAPEPGEKESSMLFLHETHQVVGAREDEFEAALPRGLDADAGRRTTTPGFSGTSTTLTAAGCRTTWSRSPGCRRRGVGAPGPARPARRSPAVDARARHLRHDVTGKTLLPVDWSPLQEVDFAGVPTDGTEHELSLFMEDTGWPYAAARRLHQVWDEIYYRPLSKTSAAYHRHAGVLPGRARERQAARSHAVAEDLTGQRLRDARPPAHLRHRA